MSPSIHPSSTVDPQAVLADDVEIGPCCSITGQVTLAAGVRVMGHAYLQGPLEIGENTTIWPFTTLGVAPQHGRPSPGQPKGVRIGKRVTVREHATIHAPWEDNGETIIGDDCLIMVGAHIGHDVHLGNAVTLANSSQISGHCVVGDKTYISGCALVHQFVRIGSLCMLSGGTACSIDVPPFTILAERQLLGGINRIGMRRNGYDREEITAVTNAYRAAFRVSMPRAEQQRILDDLAQASPAVQQLADFVRESKRGVCPGDGRPRPMTLRWLQRWAKNGFRGASEAELDAMETKAL